MRFITKRIHAVSHTLSRLFGIVLLTAGLAILLCFGYLYFTLLIPFNHPSDEMKYLDISFAIYLLIMIFFNYLMASMTDPGKTTAKMLNVTSDTTTPSPLPRQEMSCCATDLPGDVSTSHLEHTGTETTIIDVSDDCPTEKFPMCGVCRLPKPPRTHHCSICQRCVLAMDHHCPWINNCVGHRNHRYFYLLLVYLCIGAIYYTIQSWSIAWKLYQREKISWPEPQSRFQVLFLFTFLSATWIGLALAGLLAWQTFLIATAQTNIDYYVNKAHRITSVTLGETFVNVYDLGTYRNFETFFHIGRGYSWGSLLLPIRVPPKGDGIHFLTLTDFLRGDYHPLSNGKVEKEL